MYSTRTVIAYWTVQRGECHAVALTEVAARDWLADSWRYDRDPTDWTIEQSEETVPLVQGRIVWLDSECIDLGQDESGKVIETERRAFRSENIFWLCPHCGVEHHCHLRAGPDCDGPECPNPSLWFCERGEGLVQVGW